jgi:CBS domain-containing protein
LKLAEGASGRYPMRVEEVMTPDPEVLQLRDSARDAAAKMRDANIGFLPVVDDAEQLVGVVTDRDLAIRVLAEALPVKTRVEDIMTVNVVSCSPDDDLVRAEALMRANQKGRLPVLDDRGRVAGVVSIANIARFDDARRTGDVLDEITEREANIP